MPTAEEMEGKTIEGAYAVVENQKAIEKAPEPITEEQFNELRGRLFEAESKEEDICKYLQVDSLMKINDAQWSEVCRLLDKKIENRKKAASLEINKVFQEFEPTVSEVVLDPKKDEEPEFEDV